MEGARLGGINDKTGEGRGCAKDAGIGMLKDKAFRGLC